MSAPSISKGQRLLEAAFHNDVETLQQLLDSPVRYGVRDSNGLSLLQVAILRRNNEVFDYLLSLDDFPLNDINDEGHTALDIVLSHLCHSQRQHESVYERYAIELIKKEANTASHDGDLLNFGVLYGLPRIVQLLIQRGADLNATSNRDLLLRSVYSHYDAAPEVIMMLLCHGADPSVLNHFNSTAFDMYVSDADVDFSRDSNLLALENLLFFTFDESSTFQLESLLALALIESPLFHQVINLGCEIIFEGFNVCYDLFRINSKYLQILLEKFPHIVKECLESFSEFSYVEVKYNDKTLDLKNLNMLTQNPICSDCCLAIISKLNSSELIAYLVEFGKDVDKILKLVYYLLSYGMVLHEIDFEYIYKITGYNEDFKNLLFMDVQNQNGIQIREMMPRLIYDVTLDIHKIVENPTLYEFIDWEQIFHYSVHPKIQKAYELKCNEIIGRQLPKVPCLKELSRDAFRKHFLKTFKITTAKQFYTLIRLLPISCVYKKIVTYETQLY